MAEIHIKVVLDEAHMALAEEMCRSLTGMGVRVETVMPEIGVIFGQAEASLLPRVSATTGVLQATEEAVFHATPSKPVPEGQTP